MWILVGLVAVLVLLSVWLTRVNERYEKKSESTGGGAASADALVEAAWDEFGLSDDAEINRAAFDKLVRKAPAESLRRKSSVVSLAIMAIRAERFELLGPLAERAETLEGGCGETGALAVLAAAYAGDARRAQELFVRSQQAIRGCASCGTGGDGKILMQEVAIAMRALEDGAVGVDGEGPRAKGLREHREAAIHALEQGGAREGDDELTPPDDALARADAWVDREGQSADAWAAKGVALARMGSLETAERAFARALGLDARCFTAHHGLAALTCAGDARAAARVREVGRAALADRGLKAALQDLVDGFASLAEYERCCIAAAVGPLAEQVEALAEAGMRLKIALPHARARDLQLGEGGLNELVLLGPDVFDEDGVYVSAKRAVVRWDVLFAFGAEEPGLARAFGAMSWHALPADERDQLAAQVSREGRGETPQALAAALGEWHAVRALEALEAVGDAKGAKGAKDGAEVQPSDAQSARAAL